ncbi:hypothetical protein [Streptomyces sp. 8N706]|uniref:hypothetical protein n=1 Tax=Streptomyces sp. 8N706 TaxID=3457416 RepID=UPI003FD69CE4
MARLLPLILIGLSVYFWLKTRRNTAALAERWMPGRNTDPGPDAATADTTADRQEAIRNDGPAASDDRRRTD